MRQASLILSLLFSTNLLAQGPSGALGRFKAAFSGGQKTYRTFDDKQRALDAIKRFDSVSVTRALITAYATLEQELTPYAEKRRKLLPRSNSGLTYPLRMKLQPIRNLQDGILDALAMQKANASLQAMMKSLLRSKKNLPLTLQITLANCAGKLDAKELNNLLRKVGKKKDNDEESMVLLKLFTRLGFRAQGAGPWVLQRLQSKNLDVRTEAVLALASLRWPPSLEPLMDRLPKETGRLRDLIADTLAQFTGRSLGPSRKSWRDWLQKEGAPYLSGETELGDTLPTQKKSRPAEGTGTYFDIPQDGASILYVFDVSLSMKAILKRRPGRRGGAAQEKERRIDRLMRELAKALEALTPNKKFNLLGFANRLYRFADKQQPATPKNIESAKTWLKGLQLKFQTNIYDALDLAFYSAGRGSRDRYYPLTVDTIFFLSDGAPTRPKRTVKGRGRGLSGDVPDEILSAVRRWNPLRRIRIHTVGLGIRGPKANGFLRQLAKENGGTYVRR